MSMKIKVKWKSTGEQAEFSIEEGQLREGLDYAIRNNPKFWEVVRDIAGRYQAELMAKELKRRKIFKTNKKS